jgi:hypothetical protein
MYIIVSSRAAGVFLKKKGNFLFWTTFCNMQLWKIKMEYISVTRQYPYLDHI